MKKIKVGVSVDVSDVDEQIKKIKPKSKIDINVSADTSQITKALSEVTGQLKKTIKIDVDTKETLKEIEKVAVAADRIRTITTYYHWKTDIKTGKRYYEKSIESTEEIKKLAQMEKEIQSFNKKLDDMRAKAKSDELVYFLNNVQEAVNNLKPEDIAKTSIELEKLQTLTTQRTAEINKAVQANKEYAKSQEDFENKVTRTGEAIKKYSSQLDLMIQKANVSGKFGLADELGKIQNRLKEINPRNIEEASKALENCKQQAKSVTIEFNGVEAQTKKLESAQKKLKSELESTQKKIKDYSSQLDLMIQKAKVSGKFGLADELEKIQNKLKEINPNNIKEASEALANCKQQAKSVTIEFNGVESQIKKLESAQKKLNGLMNDADDFKLFDTSEAERVEASLKEIENALEQLKTTGKSMDISDVLDKARVSGEKLEDTINDARGSAKTLSGAFSEIAASLGLYIGLEDIVRGVMESFKEGVQGVIEVDAAMKSLNKVCELTEEQFLGFPDVASLIAMEIGAGQIEVIKATEYYAKLGNAIEEASEKARLAAVFRTIGDFESIDQASEALITMQKGFSDVSDSAEDMLRVMDVANEVGNNFTSTTEDIAEGLRRSSSALSEANNTYEQSVGIFVAANSSVQDAEKVGNAIKTIAMRLRGMETELDACGVPASKLREEILAITGDAGQMVDIMKDDGLTFKSTYDILDELSQVYHRLNDSQKAYLQQIIAGKQQGNIFSGIMENMTEGVEAYNTALNSSGSAMKENAIYMDGIEAKTNRLNENISMFWSRIISSNMIKGAVDGLNSVVTAVHGAGDAFGASAVAILGFATAFSPAISAIGNLIAKMGGLSTILTTVMNPLTVILGTITLVTIGLGAFQNAFTTTAQEVQEASNALSDYNNKAENLKTAKDLYSEWDRLTRKLEEGNLTLVEKKAIQDEINGITEQLGAINQDVNNVLKDGNTTLEEKKRLTEQILNLQERQNVEQLDDSMGWEWVQKARANQLENQVKTLKTMKDAIDSGWADENLSKDKAEEYKEKYDEKLQQFKLDYADFEMYNKQVEAMGDYADDFGREIIKVDENVVTFVDGLYKMEEASEEVGKAAENVGKKITAIPKFEPIKEDQLEDVQKIVDTIDEMDAFNYFNDLDVKWLSDDFIDLAESVGESANELQRFLDTYNLLTGNLNVMESVKKSIEENGYLTEEARRQIFSSGNEDLIAALADEENFYDYLVNVLMPEYNSQKEEEEERLIKTAQAHQQNKKAMEEQVEVERKRIEKIKEMQNVLGETKVGEKGIEDPSGQLKQLSEVVDSVNGAKMAIAELNGEQVLLHYDDQGFFEEVSNTKEVADGLYASMINLDGTNTVITIDENGETTTYALENIKEKADGTKVALTKLGEDDYYINFDAEGNILGLQKVKESTEGLIGILDGVDGKKYKVTIDSETFEQKITEVRENIDGTYSLIDESSGHPIEIIMNGDGEVIGQIDGINTSIDELKERKKYLQENPLKVTFEGKDYVVSDLQNVTSNVDGTYTAIGTLNGRPVKITFDNHGQIVGEIREVTDNANEAINARHDLNSKPFNPTVVGADLAIDRLNRLANAAVNARNQSGTIRFVTENVTINAVEARYNTSYGGGSGSHVAMPQSTGNEDIFAPVEATQDVVITANPIADTSEVEAFDMGGAVGDSGGGDGFSAPIPEVEPFALKTKSESTSSSSSSSNQVLEYEADRYYKLNDVLEDYENALKRIKDAKDVASSKEYVELIKEENELLAKKTQTLRALQAEQEKELSETRATLSANGFLFDSYGNLINSQERLVYWANWANEGDDSRNEHVEQLEDLVNLYDELANKSIPDTQDSIRDLNKELRGTAIDQLTELRNKLVAALKEERQQQKDSEIGILDDRITELRKQIDELEDEEGDRLSKRAKLEAELSKWRNDDSAFSTKKQQEIQKQLDELNKQIRRGELEKQIEEVEKTKDTVEETYNSMLEDKQLYEDANNLITQGKTDEMLRLLEEYSDDYSYIGTLWGENLSDAFMEEIKLALEALEYLKGESNKFTNNQPTNTTPPPSAPTPAPAPAPAPTQKAVAIGSKVKVTDTSADIYVDSYTSQSSGTWKGAYVGTSDTMYVYNMRGDRVALARSQGGTPVGWIDKKKVRAFDTGGYTGDFQGGQLAILHAKERVLSAQQTQSFEKLVSMLGDLVENPMLQLSQSTKSMGNPMTEINTNIEINNNFTVTNNTPFDQDRQDNNISQLMAKELRRFGKITKKK